MLLAGDAAHLVDDVVGAVVHGVIHAEAANRVVLARARGAVDLGADQLGYLGGRDADATGRRLDQHPLAGLEAAVANQARVGGGIGHRHRRALAVVPAVRHRDQRARLGHRQLRVAAESAGSHHALTDLEVAHPIPHGVHVSGHLVADHARRLRGVGIEPHAAEQVGEVHSGSSHADTDLAETGLGVGALLDAQHVRGTVLGDHESLHPASTPYIVEAAMRTASGTSIDVKDSILDAVGDTPLVRLSRLGKDLTPQLVAKVEALNPGGSIKDRAAIALVEAAERDGKLRPGGTIVEPTSGNTGTGLAIAAALKGYRVIAVMPDKMSKEKIDLLRAYGAEVVVAPTEVPPDSPESYYRVADRLTEEIPGAFQPNQYKNQANPEAHYRTTGPELWSQSGGQITHLVVGVGTGGTITGVGRYLREQKPDIEIIGADPVGSIYSGGEDGVKPYLVEGVGEDFWPETYDPSIVDRYITVSDRDSFLWTRRLAETEGILAGGSGGLALYAAYQVARELNDPSAMVAVILPDGGRSYLSKVFNDAWMQQYGFLEREAEQTVGDVLRRKHAEGEIPPLLTVETHAKVRDAVALLHEHRVSQLPVVSAHDPHTVVGSVSERGLLRHAMNDPALLAAEIIEVMEAPFPAIAAEDGVRAAVELLADRREALLVNMDGRAAGIVTRADLLESLAR